METTKKVKRRGFRGSANKKLNLTLDRALISLPLHSVAVKRRLGYACVPGMALD